LGLDLKWVDIRCDGSTWNAQQQISLNTDFPALIELLKQANNLRATETYSCFKERKFVDPGYNDEFRMGESQRFTNCYKTCGERHSFVCAGELTLPGLSGRRIGKRNTPQVQSPKKDCDQYNLCMKQCDYYQTKCTLSAQYFAHCPEFGFCQSSDSDEEGKDVINEDISTNTKQLARYVESSKSDKKSFESIKSSFVLQLSQNFQTNIMKSKILSVATEAYKAQYNSSLISLQIVSFQISNQSSILSEKINDGVEEKYSIQLK